MIADRLEIMPRAKRNCILVALGCSVFVLIGVWMIATGDTKEVLGGVFVVVVFGAGLVVMPRMWRRTVSMVLSISRIEQHTIFGSAVIAWKDIERIGVAKLFGNKMVGIRLKTYDNYLANMSPQLAAWLTKSLPYLKWLTKAASLLGVPAPVEALAASEGTPDVSKSLKTFGSVGNLAEYLRWTRQQCGYDILLTWSDLDRSADDFVNLLEEYRKAAEQRADEVPITFLPPSSQ